MPFIPGLLATPTVIANAMFSLAKDASLPVRSPDRVGVVSPMFNEEAGAAAALTSLLAQSVPFDALAVSINGGTDATAEVVKLTLGEAGYRCVTRGPVADATATFERWLKAGGGGPSVIVVEHAQPISKSDSINVVLSGGLLSAERVLIVDGDTVLEEHFLARLRDDFYRLRRVGHGRKLRYVLEDYAIQSGAVMSADPGRGKPVARFISRARSAEYAIAAVLRTGQTARLGEGAVFGRSRLYTVVGCGFVARRECFPMPADTLTEDHDFTLSVQNRAVTDEHVGAPELDAKGFRVVVDGEEVELGRLVGDAPLVIRHGSNARFITSALMYTDDPPSLPGYLRQIERWNGGGIENGLKRLFRRAQWRDLRANVRFTVLAAHFENLFGLALLLLMLPVAAGLNYALPGHGTPLKALGLWAGFDLAATLVLATWGFARIWRAQGLRRFRLWSKVGREAATSVVPLALLRPFNAVTFLTGAARAVPRFMRRNEFDPRATITWDRPRSRTSKRSQLRYLGATTGMVLSVATVFAGAAVLASATRPGYRDAWRLINDSVRVSQDDHMTLPLSLTDRGLLDAFVDAGFSRPAQAADPGAGGASEGLAPGADAAGPVDAPTEFGDDARVAEAQGDDRGARADDPGVPTDLVDSPLARLGLHVMASNEGHGRVSAYCSVADVLRPATKRHRLEVAEGYQPLSAWGLLVLARLAPLVANIEEASTAYDVPPDLLLRILINESYLDPLAVGPTGDLGLSQVTSDALTLLRAISTDQLSPYANQRFFAGDFSVFDPDFSVCAGAAKLAWARAQPGGEDDHFAYARYINPLEGVVRGKVSPVHGNLVKAIDELRPLANALQATVAAYRADPDSVTDKERALLGVTNLVADGRLTVAQAYFVTAELVQSFGIDDKALYDDIRRRLYGSADGVPSVGNPNQG
ncbi:MAG: transglycosylase SLT domain-containing protein [Trueperaceae bacterium]|nr:transglycosylase SLT domain-containing protein [Trueperaceae bacterium]